jgi:hypothetical protein
MAGYEKIHIIHSCPCMLYDKLYIPDKLVRSVEVDAFYSKAGI